MQPFKKLTKIAAFSPIAAGHACLLSYWLRHVFRPFTVAFLHPLRIAQRLSINLWTFPSGFPVPFKQCPAAVQEPFRAFPSSYGKNLSISLKGHVSVEIYFKSKEHLRILNTSSSFSSKTDLS
jgi:hypothetical protein